MRAVFLLLVLSAVLVGLYEIGVDELYSIFGSKLPSDRSTWFVLHRVVSTLIVVLVASNIGVWNRKASHVVKLLGVVICFVLPPMITLLNMGFVCFMLRKCI